MNPVSIVSCLAKLASLKEKQQYNPIEVMEYISEHLLKIMCTAKPCGYMCVLITDSIISI